MWLVLDRSKVSTFKVSPRNAGLPDAKPADLIGDDAVENAAHVRRAARNQGPLRDIVLLNAAALLVAGKAKTLRDDWRSPRTLSIAVRLSLCSKPSPSSISMTGRAHVDVLDKISASQARRGGSGEEGRSRRQRCAPAPRRPRPWPSQGVRGRTFAIGVLWSLKIKRRRGPIWERDQAGFGPPACGRL
ncbi:MAG: hypothetical protein R3D01_07330 [Hyphomicrobiales bacterium]